MSTITYLTDAELDAGQALSESVALEVFWSNPEAVRDLIYGPTRRIEGIAPPHDHDEDGGEPHYAPILARSFGRYNQLGVTLLGIPLGPPDTGTFAAETTNGIVSYANAKRLDCVGVILPGGCTEVRIDLTEYHETASESVTLYLCLRGLGSVNFKLGNGLDDLVTALTYTTAGAAARVAHSVTISDLGALGDPGRDRFIEASLWLGSDISATNEMEILDWQIVPITFGAVREPDVSDLAVPGLAIKELKAGLGEIGPVFISKIKEGYNSLNVGLWGSTPGLAPSSRLPDTRRRYRETITDWHQHQGALCPDGAGGIFGDGACLTDAQSFGYLRYLDEVLPLVAGTPPALRAGPQWGAQLHRDNTLATGWTIFSFRRSIPAGCGLLLLRLGIHPWINNGDQGSFASSKLLVSLSVTPVAGGSSIVTNLRCGPFATTLDAASAEYTYLEIEPEDDVSYLPTAAVRLANKHPWNQAIEIPQTEKDALGLLEASYRVTQPIEVQLTYPTLRDTETYHATGDYNIKLRCKLIDANGVEGCNEDAGLLWLCCWTPKGY